MKTTVLLAVVGGWLAACLPVGAQTAASPTPNSAYPDSPARANPTRRAAGADDGRRGPRGPLDWERTAALSPDGQRFVTRSLDGRMRVWEIVSGRSEVELPAGVVAVVFSPDSRWLACRFESAGGRSWQVFTAADGKPAGQPLAGPDPDASGAGETVVFSPDGKLLAGGIDAGPNHRFVLWDAVTGKSLAVQSGLARTLAFAPDGKTLAVVGTGSTVGLFGVPDLKPLRALASDNNRVVDLAVFSPDGKLLATGGAVQRSVRGEQISYPAASLYEVATGRLVAELKLVPNAGVQLRQIVFADGGRAVVTATDGNAQAWSAADGRLQANLPGGGFPLAISPDGKTLAGTDYPDLRCWDTTAWRLGLKIANAKAGYGLGTGPLGYVPLAFIPDGSGIVTLRGNSAAAWEMPAGRPVIERDATQFRVFY